MALAENKFLQFVFWFLLLITLLVPPWFLSFNSDNWLAPDHPQEINLNYLSDEFAPGDDLVIAVQMPQGFFNAPALERLSEIEEALKLHLGADLISRRSPLSATRIANNKNVIEVESFQSAHERGAFAQMADYKKAFDASPYHGRLLSKDNKVAAIHLRLDTRAHAQKRGVVIEKTRKVLHHLGLVRGADYHFIAKAALKNEMNEQTKKDLPLLLLNGVVILGLFLYLALRKGVPTLFLLSMGGLCVAGALSAQVLLGHEMTVISLVLPVLAAMIAIAHGLHIIFFQLEKNATAKETIAYMWRPCLFANVTTGVGAGSFIVSGLVPLAHFGWDSLLTLTLLYATVLGGFALFPLWQGGAKEGALALRVVQRVIAACHFASDKYRRGITYGGLALFLVCGAGLVRWSTETNFLEIFFKEESQIRKDFALADKQLGGSGVIDVLVRQKKPDKFKEVKTFNVMRALATKLATHPQVNYAEAMDIPVGLAHGAFAQNTPFPNSDNQLAQELLFLELSRNEAKDDILSPYVNFDYTATRIHLRTPDLSSDEIETLIADIRAATAPADKIGAVVLTGFNVFMFALGQEVLTTQFVGLGLTMGIIFFIFIFIFGARVGALGFLSNLVPIGILLGLISWLGVAFDMVLVLVAAITLGLMVDDSIHFLHRWKGALEQNATPANARAIALRTTGVPIILTSLLFCAGATVFLLSDLALLVKFGTWVMVGLAIDGISSALFLPALLAFWGERG